MKSLLIQFHATVEEIVEFVKSIRADLGLILVLLQFRPFSAKMLNDELDLTEIQGALKNSDIRLVLLTKKVNLDCDSSDDFLALNPGSIEIDVGEFTNNSLHESALSFMSDDEDAYSVAKKVASKLKKMTKAGVVAVNPDSGAEAKIRTHRYTKGAKLKYDQGIKILTVAGKSILKLLD